VTLHLKPISIAAIDSDGVLVFSEAGLIAVLTRLSGMHGDAAGSWFLEAGFGDLDHHKSVQFPDLDSAQAWILQSIDTQPRP
jgi:hypothetical protein